MKQKSFKEEGNPQWQSDYPNVETITADIEEGVAWVLIVDQKLLTTLQLLMDLIPIIKRLMANGIMILILMWPFTV
ncbi:acetyltransferase [Lactobacillus helveticus MTCC 5463]|nr:acetyltransferase [Lactobacillus helveticus MTCC 5463]